MKMVAKAKSVDLGELQDAFTAARRTAEADAKALAKAQDAADRSRAAFAAATEALKAGSRLILA
jgi:hypothetical protein